MVRAEADAVEGELTGGALACPACGVPLRPWGYARPRVLRGRVGPVPVRPRRARCLGCGQTAVLLPVVALLRRADSAAVIGAALLAAAGGTGHRPGSTHPPTWRRRPNDSRLDLPHGG